VGSVATIARYPIKSMLGETLARGRFTAAGILGDRQFALVDDETGNVVSVKRPMRWGRMFELTAVTDASGVSVSFPDGTTLAVADAQLVDRLSDFFGRRVSVATVPPPDARFEEVWSRDLKGGVNPYFDLPTHEADGEEVIYGAMRMSPANNFFNFGAVHLVTTSACRALTEHAPASRFDPHRFRPNLVIDTAEPGFVENDWPGKTLTIGEVQLSVYMVVPRCIMTTLEQGDAPADREVLRSITTYNSLDPGIGTRYPCLGVYADVVTDGEIRVGDPVVVS
jgi:uncharacterized protein YcbX